MQNIDEARIPKAVEEDWHSIEIFLFSNGQEDSPPRKYTLGANELEFWDCTLNLLAQEHYGNQQVMDLYTMDGRLVQSPLELVDGQAYVAVTSSNAFIDAGYEKYLMKACRSWEKRQARRNHPACDNDEPCCVCPEKEEIPILCECEQPFICLCAEKEEQAPPLEPLMPAPGHSALRPPGGRFISGVYRKPASDIYGDYEPNKKKTEASSGKRDTFGNDRRIKPDDYDTRSGKHVTGPAEYRARSDYNDHRTSEHGARPSERGVRPDEYHAKPDEYEVSPYEHGARPSGRGARSSERRVRPDEYHARPDEYEVSPYEHVARPSGREARPSERGVRPDDYYASPGENRVNPSEHAARSTRLTERVVGPDEFHVGSGEYGVPSEYGVKPNKFDARLSERGIGPVDDYTRPGEYGVRRGEQEARLSEHEARPSEREVGPDEYHARLGGYGVRPCEHGVRPIDHGSRPNDYHARSGEYGLGPNEHGAMPSEHRARPEEYYTKPGEYGVRPSEYGARPCEHGANPFEYGAGPGRYGVTPDDHSPEPVAYRAGPIGPDGARSNDNKTRQDNHESRSSEYGVSPSEYNGRPGDYESRSSKHEARLHECNVRPGDYGPVPGGYLARPGEYEVSPDHYQNKAVEYGVRPSEHQGGPGELRARPNERESRPCEYGARFSNYGAGPHEHTARPNEYGIAPVGYTTSQGEYETTPREYKTKMYEPEARPVDHSAKPDELEAKSHEYGRRSNDYGTRQDDYKPGRDEHGASPVGYRAKPSEHEAKSIEVNEHESRQKQYRARPNTQSVSSAERDLLEHERFIEEGGIRSGEYGLYKNRSSLGKDETRSSEHKPQPTSYEFEPSRSAGNTLSGTTIKEDGAQFFEGRPKPTPHYCGICPLVDEPLPDINKAKQIAYPSSKKLEPNKIGPTIVNYDTSSVDEGAKLIEKEKHTLDDVGRSDQNKDRPYEYWPTSENDSTQQGEFKYLPTGYEPKPNVYGPRIEDHKTRLAVRETELSDNVGEDSNRLFEHVSKHCDYRSYANKTQTQSGEHTAKTSKLSDNKGNIAVENNLFSEHRSKQDSGIEQPLSEISAIERRTITTDDDESWSNKIGPKIEGYEIMLRESDTSLIKTEEKPDQDTIRSSDQGPRSNTHGARPVKVRVTTGNSITDDVKPNLDVNKENLSENKTSYNKRAVSSDKNRPRSSNRKPSLNDNGLKMHEPIINVGNKSGRYGRTAGQNVAKEENKPRSNDPHTKRDKNENKVIQQTSRPDKYANEQGGFRDEANNHTARLGEPMAKNKTGIEISSRIGEARGRGTERKSSAKDPKNKEIEQKRQLSGQKAIDIERGGRKETPNSGTIESTHNGGKQRGNGTEHVNRTGELKTRELVNGVKPGTQKSKENERKRKLSQQKTADTEPVVRIEEPKINENEQVRVKQNREREHTPRRIEQRHIDITDAGKPNELKTREMDHTRKPREQLSTEIEQEGRVSGLNSRKIQLTPRPRPQRSAEIKKPTKLDQKLGEIRGDPGISDGGDEIEVGNKSVPDSKITDTGSRTGTPSTSPNLPRSEIIASKLGETVKLGESEIKHKASEPKNRVVLPGANVNNYEGSRTARLLHLSEVRKSASPGKTTIEKNRYSVEQYSTKGLLKRPAPLTVSSIPSKKQEDNRPIKTNRENLSNNLVSEDYVPTSNDVRKPNELLMIYLDKRIAPPAVLPPINIDAIDLKKRFSSLVKIFSNHNSPTTENTVIGNVKGDKEIMIEPKKVFTNLDNEIRYIRTDSVKIVEDANNNPIEDIQTGLISHKKSNVSFSVDKEIQTSTEVLTEALEQHVQDVCYTCGKTRGNSSHRDVMVATDDPEQNLIINKGDIVNVKLNIEVRNEMSSISRKTWSLTNMNRMEKESQISIDNDLTYSQSKSLQSILNDEYFRGFGFEGRPKVVIVQCACCGTQNNPPRDPSPCCDSVKYIVVIPTPQQDTDDKCKCDTSFLPCVLKHLSKSISAGTADPERHRSSIYAPVKPTYSDTSLETASGGTIHKLEIERFVKTTTTTCQTEECPMNKPRVSKEEGGNYEGHKEAPSQVSVVTQTDFVQTKYSYTYIKVDQKPNTPEMTTEAQKAPSKEKIEVCPQSCSHEQPDECQKECSANLTQIQSQGIIKVTSQIVHVQSQTLKISRDVSDAQTQTQWNNVMLEARLLGDGRYSFHLPPLHVLKHYSF